MLSILTRDGLRRLTRNRNRFVDVVEDIGVVVVRACVIGLPRATVSRGSPMTLGLSSSEPLIFLTTILPRLYLALI